MSFLKHLKYLQYLPLIVEAVRAAEAFADPAATGAQKKELAMDTVQAGLTAFGAPLDPGVFEAISDLADSIVGLFHKHGAAGFKPKKPKVPAPNASSSVDQFSGTLTSSGRV